jgi:hypothetical protein
MHFSVCLFDTLKLFHANYKSKSILGCFKEHIQKIILDDGNYISCIRNKVQLLLSKLVNPCKTRAA